MRRHGSSPLEGDSAQDVLQRPRYARAGNPDRPSATAPFASQRFRALLGGY